MKLGEVLLRILINVRLQTSPNGTAILNFDLSSERCTTCSSVFNPLNAELNPICYLLALLAHHFLHVSRIRVKSLTLRLLMSYIHGAHILDVSRSHTTTQQSVGLLWTSDQLVAETST